MPYAHSRPMPTPGLRGPLLKRVPHVTLERLYTYSLSNREFSTPKKAVFLSNITD
jgi:hypothetical protein